jgi:hypothetical protein
MECRKITTRIKQPLVASEGVSMFDISTHYSEARIYRGIPWHSSIFSTITVLHLCESSKVDVKNICLIPPLLSNHLNDIFVEMTALFLSVFDDVLF